MKMQETNNNNNKKGKMENINYRFYIQKTEYINLTCKSFPHIFHFNPFFPFGLTAFFCNLHIAERWSESNL